MEDKYKGMTVNERLWVSGLVDKFDQAIKVKDMNMVISILKEVELTEPNIYPILKHYKLVE